MHQSLLRSQVPVAVATNPKFVAMMEKRFNFKFEIANSSLNLRTSSLWFRHPRKTVANETIEKMLTYSCGLIDGMSE